MRLLARWDSAVLKAVQWLVDFLDGWLSFSQARLERACIAACFTAMEIAVPSWWYLHLIGFAIAWYFHRRPAVSRKIFRDAEMPNRLATQLFAVVVLGESLIQTWPHYVESLVSTISVALLFCLFAIGGDESKRGKRRRVALAKLKEIFGRAWVPELMPTPV